MPEVEAGEALQEVGFFEERKLLERKTYNISNLWPAWGGVLKWLDFGIGMSPGVCAVHGMIRIEKLIWMNIISSHNHVWGAEILKSC